jgi:recombination protein RecR
MAFHLLQATPGTPERLASALSRLREGVRFCETCSFIAESATCPICADPRRDPTVLCVVEQPTDVIAIERTGEYHGRYHVLLGAISPMDGVGPAEIRSQQLLERLADGSLEEVVLATNGDVEGEATAAYLAQAIAAQVPRVRVSRLARGLPMGGELEYADELTLARALTGRRPI